MRTRSSDRTRWFDTRRDLAARYLHATDELLKWTLAQSNIMRGWQSKIPVLTVEGVSDPETAMQRVATVSDAVGRLMTEIDLVGSQAERDAALRLREAVWDIARANGSDESENRGAQIQAAAREQSDAREGFREAARRGLVPPPRRPLLKRRP
jgi:hypothetical protein